LLSWLLYKYNAHSALSLNRLRKLCWHPSSGRFGYTLMRLKLLPITLKIYWILFSTCIMQIVCISCSTCHVTWQSRLQVYSWEGQNMKKIPCSLLEVSFVVRNPVNYGSFAFKLRRVKWFFLSTSNICFIFKWFMQAQASSISSNASFLIQ